MKGAHQTCIIHIQITILLLLIFITDIHTFSFVRPTITSPTNQFNHGYHNYKHKYTHENIHYKPESRFSSSSLMYAEERECENKNEQLMMATTTKKEKTKKTGFYVHIPYCRKRCRYCDFAIIPIGNTNTNTNSHTGNTAIIDAHVNDDVNTNTNTNASFKRSSSSSKQQKGFEELNSNYTNAIVTEIDGLIQSILQQQQHLQHNQNNNTTSTSTSIHLDSIYFGGGTPSLAPLSTIELILKHILEKYTNNTHSINENNQDDDGDNTNRNVFHISNKTEITMEMDPGTFTIQHLYSLKEMGINRISLGVQSFNDTILDSIGRIHSTQDIYNSISMISKVFGNDNCNNDNDDSGVNYSIDLISGLPGLDCAMWIETLQKAMELKPQPKHLSIYDLQIESGTVFGSWYENEILDDGDGDYQDEEEINQKRKSKQAASSLIATPSTGTDQLPLPSPDDCAFMYQFASGYLSSKGYEHYEISSYAKIPNTEEYDSTPTNNDEKKSSSLSLSSQSRSRSQSQSPNRSQHNQIYWDIGSEWYAVGLGATSCLNGRRYARPRSMSDYITWTNLLKNSHGNDNNNNDITLSAPSSSHSAVRVIQPPLWLDEEESWEHDLEDTIMTRLRTKDGLDLNWIANQKDGELILDRILHGAKLGFDLGLLEREIIKEDGTDTMYLIDPKGFLFSNTIISSIFAELP